MKGNHYVIAALIIAATVIGTLIAYPMLPARVPMHWNLSGQIDRYGDKVEIFIFPALMAGMVALFTALPWLSPRRFEVDDFRDTYLYIMLVIVAFLGYAHALTVWIALGHGLDLTRALFGAVFVLLALLGNVLGRVRRNFFIGVRTPWTLASEKVWDTTHRFAGKVFVIAGLLGLGLLMVAPALVVVTVIPGAAAVITVLHSLVIYKRLERRNEL